MLLACLHVESMFVLSSPCDHRPRTTPAELQQLANVREINQPVNSLTYNCIILCNTAAFHYIEYTVLLIVRRMNIVSMMAPRFAV